MPRLKYKLVEGRTKIIWPEDAPSEVLVESKDNIATSDAVSCDALDGIGAYTTTITTNCFRLLEAHQIRTHYIEPFNERTFRARRANMVPLRIVVRRIATGSYLDRHPDVYEGTRLPNLAVEFYEKSTDGYDPLVLFDLAGQQLLRYDAHQPISQGFLGVEALSNSWLSNLQTKTIMLMTAKASNAFLVLEAAWNRQNVVIVDLSIEFGFDSQTAELLVADIIDNSTWRLWPRGDRRRAVDHSIATRARQLEQIYANYIWVTEATNKFLTPVR